jgi:predicted DNA-binding transcriptional regulator YafY
MYNLKVNAFATSLLELMFIIALEDMAEKGVSLMFHYADETGHRTTREVKPESVDRSNDGNLLVHARCDLRGGEPRSFRFDRMFAITGGNELPDESGESVQDRIVVNVRELANRFGINTENAELTEDYLTENSFCYTVRVPHSSDTFQAWGDLRDGQVVATGITLLSPLPN